MMQANVWEVTMTKNKQPTHKTTVFVYMYKCVNHDAPPPKRSSPLNFKFANNQKAAT